MNITSKRSFCRSAVGIPLGLFLILMTHGATLGLTDDEAYYWALAQNPGWGFAFHPPAVVWLIAVFQKVLGILAGNHAAGLVRLPAAVCSVGALALAMDWMRRAGGEGARRFRAVLPLLGFSGLFASSWMMVPDLPLFLGWMLAFHSAWRLGFEPEVRTRQAPYWLLALGVALSILSKYSGILVAGCAFLSILFWVPRPWKARAIGFLVLGAFAAAVPIIIWNAQHGWASVLYQIRDRHGGGGLSWARYGKFWASQLLLAGALVPYGIRYLWVGLRGKDGARARGTRNFVALWFLVHAAVFCIQPLFSDFKMHWALMAWLAIALGLAWSWSHGRDRGWAIAQSALGLTLGAAGLMLCHWPVTAWVAERVSGREMDPRLDVTNDMYGWEELRGALSGSLRDLPVIGSRYQTSSQAAFALGTVSRVSYIPRDQKQMDEWQDLGVSDVQGPEWPRLIKPVLFVADNRYDAGPGFLNADCRKVTRLESRRWNYRAKWVDLWLCRPN